MSLPLSLIEARKELDETNDCTVMALSIACSVTYREAHEALKEAGRPHQKGCRMPTQLAALVSLGRTLKRVDMPKAKTMISLGRTLPSRGIFWAYTSKRRHVAACRGGVVLDWSANTRYRVQEVYRVVKL